MLDQFNPRYRMVPRDLLMMTAGPMMISGLTAADGRAIANIPEAADHTVIAGLALLAPTVTVHIPVIPDIVDLTTVVANTPMILDTAGP